MAVGDKARRSELLFIQRTTRKLEQTITGPALKMVVMFFPGSFVERPQSRPVDLLEPPLLHQQFQVAIDGRLIQRFHALPPCLQDFINSQRPVVLPEDLLDGMPLAGFSLVRLLFRFPAHRWRIVAWGPYCKWICNPG